MKNENYHLMFESFMNKQMTLLEEQLLPLACVARLGCVQVLCPFSVVER